MYIIITVRKQCHQKQINTNFKNKLSVSKNKISVSNQKIYSWRYKKKKDFWSKKNKFLKWKNNFWRRKNKSLQSKQIMMKKLLKRTKRLILWSSKSLSFWKSVRFIVLELVKIYMLISTKCKNCHQTWFLKTSKEKMCIWT